MKVILILLCLNFLSTTISGQTIKGEFSQLSNQPIKLLGFDNFKTYTIDSTQADAQGNFNLNYKLNDYGMGYLKSGANQSFIVALEEDAPSLRGENFKTFDSVIVEKGRENQWHIQYSKQHPKRDQALSAWLFLQKKYNQDEVFKTHRSAKKAIDNEIKQLKIENEQYIADLPKESYMKWYLPLRTLLSSVGNVAKNRPDLIPETLQKLRAIDYTEDRLSKSGILYESIFNHIWFIENSSGTLDQVFIDLNTSIDVIAEQLKDDDEKFNLIMEKMFEILEERSLFTSSEYLAEKLLKGDDCGCLNPQLQKKLERYGKMAKGQIAPDIVFSDYTYYPEEVSAKSLKEIKAEYKIVVFAASWCSHCREAMPKIAENYEAWKAKGAEVVLVSLEESTRDFTNFAAPLPFLSTTDYKKWDGKAVEDYQVYATPSYFILDKDLKILIRPKSVEHIKAWLKSYL